MKVSVVVCTYSPKMFDHFIECIESLLRQTYKDVEIICIVDGNKEYYRMIREKKGELIKEYGIKLYLNNRNLGLLESRNRGAKLASGDIVAFIDDDAIAERNWIEELIKMYRMGAIAAGGKLVPLWIAKKPQWFPEEFYWLIGATHLGFPEEVTEVRNTFGSNLSFRRDVFLELGGFNTDMGGIKGRRMLQGGETELCERMRRRYGRGVMYNPNAIVYHKIFERRTKLSFLVKRAFWQGYSKANMERLGNSTSVEKDFLKFVIGRIFRRFVAGLTSNDSLLKAVVMIVLTASVGVGYIGAKIFDCAKTIGKR